MLESNDRVTYNDGNEESTALLQLSQIGITVAGQNHKIHLLITLKDHYKQFTEVLNLGKT